MILCMRQICKCLEIHTIEIRIFGDLCKMWVLNSTHAVYAAVELSMQIWIWQFFKDLAKTLRPNNAANSSKQLECAVFAPPAITLH